MKSKKWVSLYEAAFNIDRPDGINGCQSKPLLWFNSLLLIPSTNNIASKKILHLRCLTMTVQAVLFCTYGATPQPWWWWLVKNMKKWPAAGYNQISKNSYLPYYPTLTIHTVPNQCLLSFEKAKEIMPQNSIKNKNKQARLRSQQQKKPNSIHKWAASFYLRIYQCLTMTVQAVLFCWIPHRRDASTDITCSQKPKKT